MKKKIFFMMLLLAGICFSCSKADSSEDVYNLPEQTQQTRSVDASDTKLGKAIASVIEKKDKSDYTSDYIIYSAEDDKCFIFTEEEYSFASALMDVIKSGASDKIISSEQLLKAPKKPGTDWIYAGKARNALQAIEIGYKISKQAPKGQNIEIRLIAQKDGSYNVYWRTFK